MERLSERNLHAVMTFLRNAYAQPDLDAFARVVVGDITHAIGAQRVSYNEVHPKRGTIRALIRPADTYPWLNGQQYQEHPVMQSFVRTRDGRARKLSDFPAAGCTVNGEACASGCCEPVRRRPG